MKTGQHNKPTMLPLPALLKRVIFPLDHQSQFAMELTTVTALKLRKLSTLTHGRDTIPFPRSKEMDQDLQSLSATELTLVLALKLTMLSSITTEDHTRELLKVIPTGLINRLLIRPVVPS